MALRWVSRAFPHSRSTSGLSYSCQSSFDATSFALMNFVIFQTSLQRLLNLVILNRDHWWTAIFRCLYRVGLGKNFGWNILCVCVVCMNLQHSPRPLALWVKFLSHTSLQFDPSPHPSHLETTPLPAAEQHSELELSTAWFAPNKMPKIMAKKSSLG